MWILFDVRFARSEHDLPARRDAQGRGAGASRRCDDRLGDVHRAYLADLRRAFREVRITSIADNWITPPGGMPTGAV